MNDNRPWIGGIVAVVVGIVAYFSGTVEAQQRSGVWHDICQLICRPAPAAPPQGPVSIPVTPVQPPEQTYPVIVPPRDDTPPAPPDRYTWPMPPVTPLPRSVETPKAHKPKPHKAKARVCNETLPPCFAICSYTAGMTKEQMAAEARSRNPSACMRQHALACLAGCRK